MEALYMRAHVEKDDGRDAKAIQHCRFDNYNNMPPESPL